MLPEIPEVVPVAVLSSVINGAFGILLSVLIEIVPGFSAWWDKVESHKKQSIRALVALVLAILIVLFMRVLDLWVFVLVTVQDWVLLVFAIGAAWVGFLSPSEGFYQMIQPALPRKNKGKEKTA